MHTCISDMVWSKIYIDIHITIAICFKEKNPYDLSTTSSQAKKICQDQLKVFAFFARPKNEYTFVKQK